MSQGQILHQHCTWILVRGEYIAQTCAYSSLKNELVLSEFRMPPFPRTVLAVEGRLIWPWQNAAYKTAIQHQNTLRSCWHQKWFWTIVVNSMITTMKCGKQNYGLQHLRSFIVKWDMLHMMPVVNRGWLSKMETEHTTAGNNLHFEKDILRQLWWVFCEAK